MIELHQTVFNNKRYLIEDIEDIIRNLGFNLHLEKEKTRCSLFRNNNSRMGKRVLVLIGGSYISGLEVATLHLIGELKRAGHSVRCIVNGWNDGMIIKELQKMEVPFDEAKLGWLYLMKPRWTIDSLIHLPGAYFKCRKILKEFDPDIVHLCNYASVILLAPLLKNRRPAYITSEEPHEPNRKNLFIYQLLNRRVRIFTAVSRLYRAGPAEPAYPEG